MRLNVTKTGFGVTAGGKVARYSVHSSGRRTVGLGLPGTGAYYQQSSGGSRGGTSAVAGGGPPAAGALDPTQLIPKPGLLASVAERAYHRGFLSFLTGDYAAALESFEWVLATDPSATSAGLFAGVAANSIDDAPRAIKHLESVVGSANGLPDRYQAKFMPADAFSLTLAVRITDSVTATPPFGELAAALALAELYQTTGRLEEAIGLLQQLYESLPDPLVRLSLCDLLYAAGDYDDVLETSAGVTNESDTEVETMHLRGAAFLATEHPTAAVETFTAALAKTSNREGRLLNAVRYDRAIVLAQLGQAKRARDDLERVYAADPAFEDVRERLAATS